MKCLTFFIICIATLLLLTAADTVPEREEKILFFPPQIWAVPSGNDWNSPDSQFTVHRMQQSEHFAAFWTPEFGDCPSTAPGALRFDIDTVLAEADRMWAFFHDELGFDVPGITDRYLMHIYFFQNPSAHGGGAGGRIGAVWMPPDTVQRPPFTILAHEIAHAFQYIMRYGGNFAFRSNAPGSYGQAIWEIAAQFMVFHLFDNWMTLDNWMLRYFINQSHLGFLHENQRYFAPYVLEFWAYLHGSDIVARLWRDVRQGEDIIMAYQRMFNMTQEAFNDEIFEASRRFITWDINRIRDVARNYANQHHSAFDYIGDGWFLVSPDRTPQNYGYNGIRLEVPPAGTDVVVEFNSAMGTMGNPAFRNIRPQHAGWRYGFVAMLRDGSRVYSDIFSDHNDGRAEFTVPDDTQYLWLVVMGAPAAHWEHLWTNNPATNEQWPYQIRLTGTELHRTVRIGFIMPPLDDFSDVDVTTGFITEYASVAVSPGGLARGTIRAGVRYPLGEGFMQDASSWWSGINNRNLGTVDSNRQAFFRLTIPDDVALSSLYSIQVHFTVQMAHNAPPHTLSLFSLNERMPEDVSTMQAAGPAGVEVKEFFTPHAHVTTSRVASNEGDTLVFDITDYVRQNPRRVYEFAMLADAQMLSLLDSSGILTEDERQFPRFIIATTPRDPNAPRCTLGDNWADGGGLVIDWGVVVIVVGTAGGIMMILAMVIFVKRRKGKIVKY